MAVDLCDALGANLCLQCKSAGKEGFFFLVGDFGAGLFAANWSNDSPVHFA